MNDAEIQISGLKEPMAAESKRERLYGQLRMRINRMEDGAPFPSVRALMKKYQVSQGVVDVALQRLKDEGLLLTRNRSGMRVCRRRDAGKQRLILMQSNWPSPHWDVTWNAFHQICQASGLEPVRVRFDYQQDATELFLEQDADAIVLDGIANDRLTPRQILNISESPAPVVLLRNAVNVENISYVCLNETAVGAIAAKHLLRHGHRKVGFLYNEPHLLTCDNRLAGFSSIVEAGGGTVQLLDCGLGPGGKPEAKISEFMEAFHAGAFDFTALYTVSRAGALLVQKELKRLGRRIPDDLSLVSTATEDFGDPFDWVGTSSRQYCEQTLETIRALLQDRAGSCRHVDVFPQLHESGTVLTVPSAASAASMG